jgi:hypothetical protein
LNGGACGNQVAPNLIKPLAGLHAESVSTETGRPKRAKPHMNSIGIQRWSHSWGVSPAVVQEFESDFWGLNMAEIDCSL